MQRENTTGPYENFTFISALKTNALSKRRPTCIQCGQLCHLVWYAYTQQTAKEILASKQRELKSIEFFGESDSLHQTLKKLTDSFLVCQECFAAKNLPKSMAQSEFEP